MKKTILIVLLAFVLSGCVQSENTKTTNRIKSETCKLVATTEGFGGTNVYKCQFESTICYITDGYYSGGISCMEK